LIMNRFVVCC